MSQYFGKGWTPIRHTGEPKKTPVGRFCEGCKQGIKHGDQGYIVHNPWGKLPNVYHRDCMPKEKPVEEQPAAEAVVDAAPAPVTNGIHHPTEPSPPPPVESRIDRIAESLVAAKAEEPPPEPKPEPPKVEEPAPSAYPKADEIEAFFRTLDLDTIRRLMPRDVVHVIKKNLGIELRKDQAYHARLRALHDKGRPAEIAPKLPPPPSRPIVAVAPPPPAPSLVPPVKPHKPGRGELAAFMRSIPRELAVKMSVEDLVGIAKQKSILATDEQMYQSRYWIYLRDDKQPAKEVPVAQPKVKAPKKRSRETKERVLEYIKGYIADHGSSPRGTAIMAALGLTQGGVSSAIYTLAKHGRIVLEEPGNYTSIKVPGLRAPAAPAAPTTTKQPRAAARTATAKTKTTASDNPLRAQLEAMIEQVKEEAQKQIEAIEEKRDAKVEALEKALEALD